MTQIDEKQTIILDDGEKLTIEGELDVDTMTIFNDAKSIIIECADKIIVSNKGSVLTVTGGILVRNVKTVNCSASYNKIWVDAFRNENNQEWTLHGEISIGGKPWKH